MKFVAAAADFLKGLQDIQGIAGQRSINPMLSETLLEANEKGVTIYATDLSVSVQEFLAADVAGEGSLVVQAKKLFEIARQLPDAKVTVESVGGSWLKVESGRAKFKIVGLPAEEFPAMPEYDPSCLCEINFPLLRSAFGKIISSMCENDARKYLNGGLMELGVEEGAVFVSTDSHRLAWKTCDIGYKVKGDEVITAIVPKNTINEIMRLFTDDQVVQMGIDKRRLLVKGEKLILISALIDTDYPDYRAVIPQSWSFRATLGREEMINVLRRVAVCSDPRTHRVRFFLKDGAFTLVGEDAEIGEAIDTVEAVYEGEGLADQIQKQKEQRQAASASGEEPGLEARFEDHLEVDYNAAYLEDALKTIESDKVLFEFTEPSSGCVIKPEEEQLSHLCIIMPMGR